MVCTRARWSTAVVFVCVFAGACWSQLAERSSSPDGCSGKSSCGECIRSAGCHWCSAPDHQRSRCYLPDPDGDDSHCDEEYITNSKNTLFVSQSGPLTRGKTGGRVGWGSEDSTPVNETSGHNKPGGGQAVENLVQLKPQRVRLQLRTNEMQQLRFAYSQAQDYPVDLYYLMDLSSSMKDDKEKLNSLGNLLSETMRNITNNFRLGFGSFVDKVAMPYISPECLKSTSDGYAVPYGYKHLMSLSTNYSHFTGAVHDAEVSINVDNPEGGFDAIMQAIVCKSEIGWRDQARRLLVYSTDSTFHYAGDGKLGGITQPNDGLCHLDQTGTYTHAELQDYPSVSHIDAKVKQHAINLIFAVTSDLIPLHKKVVKQIEGSSCGELTSHSNNVVDLVKDQYNQITSAVEMKSNASNAVDIVFKSACLGTRRDWRVTNKCDGLKVGDVVYFTAEITLKECPKDPKEWKQTFRIHPVGVSDSLIVELDMICDCPCEHSGHKLYKKGPDVCEGNGALGCGVCLCDLGHFGKNCECSAARKTFPEMERGCRPQNSTSGPICSNRGICQCGVCHCNKKDGGKEISGPYCECDNFSCDLNKGVLCSGNGRCVCGKCMCNAQYSGSACDCLLDQSPCVSPENGKICSGNGRCSCGKCVCTADGDKHYSGDYCEKCLTCPGRCAEFKDCVLCEVHARGPMLQGVANDTQCGECSLHPIIVQGNLEANETIGEHLCSFYDNEDCLYAYVYSYDAMEQLVIRAQKGRECPPKVFVLGIVLGAIAATVLVGMALLMLWKLATTIHDRREFARFENEQMKAQWETAQNPIYKEATTTFKNPTYCEN